MLFRQLGPAPYARTYAQMLSFTKNREAASEDEVWFCEHDPVYTVGTSSKNEDLPTKLNGIPLIKTDRGGKITYHGPGQIVCYPLINLKRRKLLPKAYLKLLESAIINTLHVVGIQAYLVENSPGVYVRQLGGIGKFKDLAKIGFIGLRIHNGCTYHGISLNISADLNYFSMIDPCGYEGLRVVNLNTLRPHIELSSVQEILQEKLEEKFREQ